MVFCKIVTKSGLHCIINKRFFVCEKLPQQPQNWSVNLTLYHAGGGLARPPLGVISCHSVVDAPTNPKFLDFSNKHPYFHLVKSFFIFFVTSTKKTLSKIFFDLKKNDFLTKLVKNIVFSQILAFFDSIM